MDGFPLNRDTYVVLYSFKRLEVVFNNILELEVILQRHRRVLEYEDIHLYSLEHLLGRCSLRNSEVARSCVPFFPDEHTFFHRAEVECACVLLRTTIFLSLVRLAERELIVTIVLLE